MFSLSAPTIWLVLLVAFILIEIATVGLLTIWFAGGALAGFLKQHGVNALICGGIGGGARTALAEAGIELYPGVSGSADAAVNSLLNGTLLYNPDTVCAHHHHEGGHDCGSHSCREDKHGCAGNH